MSDIDTDEYAYRHYSLEDDPDPRPWEEYYRVYGLDYDGLCDPDSVYDDDDEE
jgi:hypothetical protein